MLCSKQSNIQLILEIASRSGGICGENQLFSTPAKDDLMGLFSIGFHSSTLNVLSFLPPPSILIHLPQFTHLPKRSAVINGRNHYLSASTNTFASSVYINLHPIAFFNVLSLSFTIPPPPTTPQFPYCNLKHL